MKTTVLSLPTFEKLQEHVHQTLCSCDHLDPAQTTLTQALLQRAGKPCGMTFQVQGPRLVRVYAVWAAQEHRVLFYDSTGTLSLASKCLKNKEMMCKRFFRLLAANHTKKRWSS